MRGVSRPEHRFRLTKPLKADLCVWREFLHTYNGRTCCQEEEVSNMDLSLYTDAAGSAGSCAILGNDWCSGEWPLSWRQAGLWRNLALLELFPIVVAVEVWGDRLQYKRIGFWTDNLSVVHCIARLSYSSLTVLSLPCRLVLRCLQLNIWFRSSSEEDSVKNMWTLFYISISWSETRLLKTPDVHLRFNGFTPKMRAFKWAI